MKAQQISYSNNKEEQHNYPPVNINLYEKYLDPQTKNGIINFIKQLSSTSDFKETKN
ncbi:hypothetical protein JQC72_06345 [Polycladomyces sp. WAk]|uniref:Uncharacterized protein n=1 Tax=Polycladomyces zharkentensis TaxID=2807616 RepID=A0ABS2WHX0_9BACL|nr:hypothetical protein [Polycladomyces sp. WAk]MBN2909142.1 hypothetical protein [Polycladomyces sp. WAk]